MKKIMELYRKGLNHKQIADVTKSSDKKVIKTILKEKRMK